VNVNSGIYTKRLERVWKLSIYVYRPLCLVDIASYALRYTIGLRCVRGCEFKNHSLTLPLYLEFVEFAFSVNTLDGWVSAAEKLLPLAKFDHVFRNLIFSAKIGALGVSGIVVYNRNLIFLSTGSGGIHGLGVSMKFYARLFNTSLFVSRDPFLRFPELICFTIKVVKLNLVILIKKNGIRQRSFDIRFADMP
jgi:hypothetical protein